MRLGPMLLVVLVAMVASGCTKDVTPTADEYICVYDGHKKGGQRLLFSLPPGANGRSTDKANKVVHIPASNRFYAMTEDAGVRDPGAPRFLEASAKGNVVMHIEGQVRFRFNDNPCDWFAKHGRRNAIDGTDMKFNARGNPDTPWERWLRENFGVTAQQVAQERTNRYDWAKLHYDYPINANDIGEVKGKPGEPALIAYGHDLGVAFTERLKENLGGEFFCGIEPPKPGENQSCPPMNFQVFKTTPVNPELVASRDKAEAQKQEQQNQNAQAAIQQQQADNLKRDIRLQKAQQVLLAEQVKTARLQVLLDNGEKGGIDVLKCVTLAKAGLDCDGHFPTGGNVTVNNGK